MYTGEAYWTITPASFENDEAKVFAVNSDGSLGIERIDSELGIYPVIFDHFYLDYGTGSYSDPFVVYNLSEGPEQNN